MENEFLWVFSVWFFRIAAAVESFFQGAGWRLPKSDSINSFWFSLNLINFPVNALERLWKWYSYLLSSSLSEATSALAININFLAKNFPLSPSTPENIKRCWEVENNLLRSTLSHLGMESRLSFIEVIFPSNKLSFVSRARVFVVCDWIFMLKGWWRWWWCGGLGVARAKKKLEMKFNEMKKFLIELISKG